MSTQDNGLIFDSISMASTNFTQILLYLAAPVGAMLFAITSKVLIQEIITRWKQENRSKKILDHQWKILSDLDKLSKSRAETIKQKESNQTKEGNFRAGQATTSAEASRVMAAETSRVIAEARTNFDLLEEYHSQGISQSKISFWFSILFASLGFSLIAYSVISYINSGTPPGTPNDISKPIFSLVAGTIADAVSALFFVQSNKSRQLMSEFFDKLRIDRKLEESLKLISSITDDKMRSRLQTMIAINFSDVKFDNGTLKLVYGEGEHAANNTVTSPEEQPSSK